MFSLRHNRPIILIVNLHIHVKPHPLHQRNAKTKRGSTNSCIPISKMAYSTLETSLIRGDQRTNSERKCSPGQSPTRAVSVHREYFGAKIFKSVNFSCDSIFVAMTTGQKIGIDQIFIYVHKYNCNYTVHVYLLVKENISLVKISSLKEIVKIFSCTLP